MESERNYGNTLSQYAAIGADCQPDRPYLVRLNDIEQELETSANFIEEFIARCRGGGLSNTAKPPAPVVSGHFATLDRIVEQMTRVSKLSRELGSIG